LRSFLAPQRLAHPLARVPHLERGHMGVALGCRHPRMAKHLLNDADVHACSISSVAAVCRASWIRASRTPACLSRTRETRPPRSHKSGGLPGSRHAHRFPGSQDSEHRPAGEIPYLRLRAHGRHHAARPQPPKLRRSAPGKPPRVQPSPRRPAHAPTAAEAPLPGDPAPRPEPSSPSSPRQLT
jgi:hypothetical protein